MMSNKKYKLPKEKKAKIQLLKAITAGKPVSKVLADLLPEKFIVFKVRTEGIYYKDETKLITDDEARAIITAEGKDSKLTVIWVTYGNRRISGIEN